MARLRRGIVVGVSLSLRTELLASRYLMEDRIAAGGMGEVWRAVDLVLDRPVAVKLLRPEYAEHPDTLARFRAEARHAAAVTHPAIAQVYDYCEARPGQPPFLVMELVDGPPLSQLLAAGPLDHGQVLDIVAQAADGLAAAHAVGLVHRDVKPGNLLLGPGDSVKITDFGIAHAAGSAPLTRTGTLIGTPAYLAPERVAGASAQPASDLYSLGIVAYECLAGTLPFTGTSIEIALAHQRQPLPPLPTAVSPPVAALVAAMTAKDPARRPGSAQQVAARARELRSQLPGGGRWSAGPPGRNRPRLSGLPTQTGDIPTAMLAGFGADGHGDEGHGDEGPRPSHSRGSRPFAARLPALLAVAIVLTALAVGGWFLASGSGKPPPQHPSRPHLATVARPHTVDVPGTLIGQPARAVARQLRHRGLVVVVRWLPNQFQQFQQGQQPGTVLSIRPTGRVRVGTTVYVTAVSPRHGFGYFRHHGGFGGGDGGSGGQGGN
jgi:eukaryotic-like serine/threonine-protein kinase